MTSEAYWKRQARRYEEQVKALGGITPEQLAEMREKARKYDDALDTLGEAHKQAKTETRDVFMPKLVRAEFKAALTGRVSDEQLEQKLDAITGPLDLAHFLTDSDDVDTAKVKAFVDAITARTQAIERIK